MTCPGCGKPINFGMTFIVKDGYNWHPRCFKKAHKPSKRK